MRYYPLTFGAKGARFLWAAHDMEMFVAELRPYLRSALRRHGLVHPDIDDAEQDTLMRIFSRPNPGRALWMRTASLGVRNWLAQTWYHAQRDKTLPCTAGMERRLVSLCSSPYQMALAREVVRKARALGPDLAIPLSLYLLAKGGQGDVKSAALKLGWKLDRLYERALQAQRDLRILYGKSKPISPSRVRAARSRRKAAPLTASLAVIGRWTWER